MIVSTGLTVPVAVTARVTAPRVTGADGVVNGSAAAGKPPDAGNGDDQ